jgi:hypothetical protein
MAYAAEGVFSYGKPVARGPVPRAEAEIAAARAREILWALLWAGTCGAYRGIW